MRGTRPPLCCRAMPAQRQPLWRRAYAKVRCTLYNPPEFDAPDRAHTRVLTARVWQGEYDWPGFVPRRGWRVLDIGANVGVFSVLSATRGAHVVAFEPDPETFAFLERNAAGYDVKCHQAAIAARRPATGTLPLFLGERDTQHSLGGFGPSMADAKSLDVPALAAVDLLADGCDLLKTRLRGSRIRHTREPGSRDAATGPAHRPPYPSQGRRPARAAGGATRDRLPRAARRAARQRARRPADRLPQLPDAGRGND